MGGVWWPRNQAFEVPTRAGSFRSELFQEVLDEVCGHGVVVVAAVGNDADDAIDVPAAAGGVLGVRAIDDTGRVAPFSNNSVRRR